MISVSAVNYQYRGRNALVLDGISLEIKKQSIFGLLGPNGAGKTTLISLLTGVLAPQSGTLSVMGRSFPSDAKWIKSQSGYVPQGYAFYPNLTAQENLAFFAGIQGLHGNQMQTRIQYCVDFCQLSDVRNQLASQFSGGLKRRLNLAIGLLTDPQILYLDEPTVGIDPQTRTFILTQLEHLRAQGKTIIYSSHYMDEVEQVCDHLAIIDRGKVLATGSLQSLRAQQTAQCCIRLDQPLLPPQLDELAQQYRVIAQGCQLRFQGIDEYSACVTLGEKLARYGRRINAVTFGESSLEDVFLGLTHRSLRD